MEEGTLERSDQVTSPSSHPDPIISHGHVQENPFPTTKNICVNCEMQLETEEEQVTEFLAVFSDCERNVSLDEALGSVFALKKQQLKAKEGQGGKACPESSEGPSSPVVLQMCVKCAEILATLYKAYVELMEQSKATAYLTRVIRQVQLWHIQHGQTLPHDFPYHMKKGSEEEYQYLNSVLAIEFDDDQSIAMVRYEEDGLSEDDIPISTRRAFRRRESHISGANLDETIVSLNNTDIRTIPKKRKIIDQENEDNEVKKDDCDWSEEFQFSNSKSASRRKSSMPIKRPTSNDVTLTEENEDLLRDPERDACVKRRSVRKRGRPAKFKNALGTERKPKKTKPLPRLKRIQNPDTDSEDLTDPKNGEKTESETDLVVSPVSGVSTQTNKLKPKGTAHVVKIPKIACPHCDTKFIYNWMLENHILSLHEKKPPIGCDICGLQFFKEDLMAKHTCIPKELQEEERKKRPHFCLQCGKTFLLQKHCKQHFKCHDEEKPYKCGQCSQLFKSENFLRFHEKLHTERSWVCSVCGKIFYVKRNLTIHMDIHEAVKKYLCSQCGEKFAQQKALRRHISAQHEPVLKHKCQICGKGFKRKDHITQHMNSKVHPKPSTTSNEALTELSSKGKSTKLPTSSHAVSTSSSIFVRNENPAILLPASAMSLCSPNLFNPISHSHFITTTAQTVQNPRPAADFGFSDFMAFE